ncbi:MAG: hypothetical protein R6V45_03290 [Oceanipulchritudo sp.]
MKKILLLAFVGTLFAAASAYAGSGCCPAMSKDTAAVKKAETMEQAACSKSKGEMAEKASCTKGDCGSAEMAACTACTEGKAKEACAAGECAREMAESETTAASSQPACCPGDKSEKSA